MLTWDFFSSANKKDPKRMLGQSDFIFSNVLKGNAHMADSNPELNLHKTYCKISRPSGTESSKLYSTCFFQDMFTNQQEPSMPMQKKCSSSCPSWERIRSWDAGTQPSEKSARICDFSHPRPSSEGFGIFHHSDDSAVAPVAGPAWKNLAIFPWILPPRKKWCFTTFQTEVFPTHLWFKQLV